MMRVQGPHLDSKNHVHKTHKTRAVIFNCMSLPAPERTSDFKSGKTNDNNTKLVLLENLALPLPVEICQVMLSFAILGNHTFAAVGTGESYDALSTAFAKR